MFELIASQLEKGVIVEVMLMDGAGEHFHMTRFGWWCFVCCCQLHLGRGN